MKKSIILIYYSINLKNIKSSNKNSQKAKSIIKNKALNNFFIPKKKKKNKKLNFYNRSMESKISLPLRSTKTSMPSFFDE